MKNCFNIVLAGVLAAGASVNFVSSKAHAEMDGVPPVEVEAAVEFSEKDLFTALGQYMALSGAIADLQLSDKDIEIFAKALAQPLVDVDSIGDVEDSAIQAGIESAVARLDALEAGEEAPALENDAAKMLGYVVAMQAGIVGINISAEEGGWVEAGAKLGANMSEPTPELMAALGPLSEMIDARVQAIMAAQGGAPEAPQGGAASVEAQKAASAQYLKQLAEDEPELQTTESGLRYLVLEEGTGPKPGASDTVRVHYHGTLIDGSVFDSSVQRGTPADFPLRGVVPGFSEGLQQIEEGGKIRLFIPAHLGYGDSPRPGGPIPGGALIIFDCELIAINP